MSDTACFHCGEPVVEARWPVTVAGSTRQTCCPGCQAVCQTIVGMGLENYYLHRDRTALRLDAAPVPENLFSRFDDGALAESGYISSDDGGGGRECTLMVEGLRCAACGWLIEKSLAAVPGVQHVSVNVTTGRAHVRWSPERLALRELLLRLRRLGYRALPFRAAERDALMERERRQSLLRLVVAAFGMMQVMMFAVGLYWDLGDTTEAGSRDYVRAISALITTPVLFYSGWPFLRNAWTSIRGGVPGMDVPIAVALLLAYFASLWAITVDGPEVWFDSVVMFVFLLSGGRHLELEARRKAGRVVENLSAALPVTATRVTPEGDAVIPAVQLRAGDRVRVRPGETLPADGRILEGAARLDEALLTGESTPVPRAAGDLVTGGSTNLDGVLLLEVTASPGEGRLSRILDLVGRAQATRPRLQEIADRISAHFVVGLLALTALTWLAWHFIDPSRAFWIALAVLVVSCPCALSLATPVAYTVATQYLTSRGLLVSRGHVLSTLPAVRAVVFDKTGTLTAGRPVVAGVELLAPGLDEAAVRRVAAALEADSEHPLARAFRDEAPAPLRATDVRIHAGRGLEGTVEGTRYRIGALAWVADGDFAPAPAGPDGGAAVGGRVFLACAGRLLCAFELRDAARPGAAAMVQSLQRAGLSVHLLSGDASGEAHRLAGELGITDVRAGASPEDKVAWLEALRSRGAGPVLMVGDGINDAPVLAAADVSIAMADGTDLARQSADAVLLRADLSLVTLGFAAAEATAATVRQNLAWALGYNLLMVPLAVVGLVNPWIASVGMATSSLVVVANALRLEHRTRLYAARRGSQNPADADGARS